MAKGKASGYRLSASDARIVLGMQARGDRDHDIAAWFGVNQGRVAEVKDGSRFATTVAAPAEELPPKGPPGIKGQRLRAAIDRAVADLEKGDPKAALAKLLDARKRYDSHEM
jgi:hypothetical protein